MKNADRNPPSRCPIFPPFTVRVSSVLSLDSKPLLWTVIFLICQMSAPPKGRRLQSRGFGFLAAELRLSKELFPEW